MCAWLLLLLLQSFEATVLVVVFDNTVASAKLRLFHSSRCCVAVHSMVQQNFRFPKATDDDDGAQVFVVWGMIYYDNIVVVAGQRKRPGVLLLFNTKQTKEVGCIIPI